jgi:hypothetical protein
MRPLYATRLEDLGPDDRVKIERLWLDALRLDIGRTGGLLKYQFVVI